VTTPSREDLLAEIAREESRLVDLRAEVETAATRLAGLREQLATLPVVHVQIQPKLIPDVANVPATNAAKVGLFRSLFRGRDDVFPRRWENEKKGKSGYSPACDNEWEWGLCEKKKGPGAGKRATCGECPNQAFITVSAEEIAKHLRGDQIMGVYPLLPDETCWFLAADFDKKSWQEDIAAFAETCRQHGVPVAIERSRSANGAHAWFFFASPVPAVTARKLGCFLITETMARRHQHRNDLIFDDVVRALEQKRSPILLTERRNHLEHFAERLQSFTRLLVVLHGGMKPKERHEVIARLAAIPAGEERLLIATGRYIGEGFDDARLDTLFLALPVSWKGTLIQYTGRLHRLHPGKTEVRIYDYVDRAVPMLMKMFEKRLRGDPPTEVKAFFDAEGADALASPCQPTIPDVPDELCTRGR
jgi:hypothetical protein